MIMVPLAALATIALSPPEAIVPDAWKDSTARLQYSPANRIGDLIILSGVVAGVPGRMPDDPLPDEDAMMASFDRAFKAIEDILTEAGTDWDHVAEIQTFHTDLTGQIEAFMAVKERYIKAPYPAWTAIDIDRLYPDGGLVEIKITAAAKT